MTRTLILTLAVVIALAAPPFNRAQTPDGGKTLTPEQELKALDLSWHQAVAARDVEALGRLLADDYGLNLDGVRTLTKEQEVEAVRASDGEQVTTARARAKSTATLRINVGRGNCFRLRTSGLTRRTSNQGTVLLREFCCKKCY